jgi:hypothetical protein
MKQFLAALVLLIPAVVFAQGPFDGTWKLNLDKSKPSSEAIVFSVSNGMYDCGSCVPRIHVKADGNDQPVAGLPHDTIAVKEIDSHTITIVAKIDGKIVSEQIRTASENGQRLQVKVTMYSRQGAKPTVEENTSERVGKSVPGANTTSGSWRTRNLSLSENGLLVTCKETNNELSVSTPTGSSFTAKFDGNYYAVKGSYGADSVLTKRINDRTIELSFKASGTVVRVNTITISTDGKTMTTVSESKMSGRVSTWVATKQ